MGDENKTVLKVDTGASGVRTVNMNFPSNTKKDKEEKKKVQKIVTGEVRRQKKSVGKKFLETFITDDFPGVFSYVINDILIPAAKGTISDMFHSSIDMIFGGAISKYTNVNMNRNNNQRTNYGNCSLNLNNINRPLQPQQNLNRARHNFDDIALNSRAEATEVLSNLVDLTLDYGQATVEDLYGFVGLPSDFVDARYGWHDLSTATIRPARGGGYMLVLPKTIVLN
jgi:hypothetical protein